MNQQQPDEPNPIRCETCRHYNRGYCQARCERMERDDACSGWQSTEPNPRPTAADFDAIRAAIDEAEAKDNRK